MLPSELRLTCLGHCYVHLPETFVSKEPVLKGGAVVSIKSIQDEHELLVMWNGQLTSGEHVELDLSFGRANNLNNELVIISSLDNPQISECSSCRVELLDSTDFEILSQHTEINILDTCKLITLDLVMPVSISKHVKVMVKVVSFEPSDKSLVMLTKWTELSFIHDLNNQSKPIEQKNEPDIKLKPFTHAYLPFLSCLLEIGKSKFYLGPSILCGDRGSGKTYVLKKVLEENKSYHSEYFNCKQLRGKRPESIRKIFNDLLARAQIGAQQTLTSIIALDDIDSFLEFDTKHEEEKGQEVLYKKRLIFIFCSFLKQFERRSSDDAVSPRKIAVVASCLSFNSLDRRISAPEGRRYFAEVVHIKAPDLKSRIKILKNIIDENQQVRCALDYETDLELIAHKCQSYMPSDLRRIYERALISACSKSGIEFSTEPVTIRLGDFLDSIEGFTPINLRTVSLQPKNDLRTFDHIGGMKDIKDVLMKTILLPLKYPKLYKKFPLKSQNSILLYGPPGCGKTMLAEASTNQDGINSICVRGPELLSKYIGSSEASVRNLFKRAQLARPCVIFFDEFESLVAKRGADSTGVTDRVVNQFLTILDGVEGLGHDVFIVATTSRPDMIDPAMLRPGRLDKHIYCPLPDTQTRLEIIEIIGKSVDLSEDIDRIGWAHKLEKFTGADIQSLFCSAQLKALNELLVYSENIVKDVTKELHIQVLCRHLEQSFKEMQKDIDSKYENIQKNYPPTINSLGIQRVAVRATLA